MVTVVQNGGIVDPKIERTAFILKRLRDSSIEEVASQLAQNAGYPYIDLHIFPIGSEDVLLIPEATEANIVLFHKKWRIVLLSSIRIIRRRSTHRPDQ
jgi:hypothetical protein